MEKLILNAHNKAEYPPTHGAEKFENGEAMTISDGLH